MHVRNTCNGLVLPNTVDSAGHAQIAATVVAVVGDVEVAVAVHDHGRIVTLILRCVRDGFVDPRSTFVRVVLEVAGGILVNRGHDVNGIGDGVNHNGRSASAVVVITRNAKGEEDP